MSAKEDKKEVAASAEASSEEASAPPSGSKRKARQAEPVPEPRTPNKRQRVPVSRFQSPLEELETRFKPEKEEKKKDDVMTLYKKNTFLAVRGAEALQSNKFKKRTFYLCRTAQNIYSTSKKLRIQWLSLDGSSKDLYKFDYVDTTEMETVLTEITMDKVTKNSYRLPASEQKRADKILDRAIRVEKGIATADEVEEEAMEEIDADDDDDDSDEDDDEPPKKRGRSSSPKKTPGRGKNKASTPASKRKGKESAKKSKEKERSAKKKDKKERKKGPDRHLKPNPKIKILEKDPFFETKEKVPEISPQVTAKLMIRAVNMGDVDAVKELLSRTEGIDSFDRARSVADSRNALAIAGELGNKQIIELLTKEEFASAAEKEKRKRKPAAQPILTSMSTGEYNPTFLGIGNIRALNVSRGSKEGNEAFLKEQNNHFGVDRGQLVKKWMRRGVSVDTMETLLSTFSVQEQATRDGALYLPINEINEAVKRGHRQLAAKYVAEAERLSGFGFNFLHKEVLNFEKEDLRDIILAASVRKKPFSNDALTPLHCAAINPNVKYLRRLLSIEPDLNILTKSRARPIHYAAACEGTGPLEFLLERFANASEGDSSGELPIHWAARSGRSKNIDVLVKHANAQPGSSSDKWGVGHINRPNRFSECPLHLAVEAGHLDVVRTLIKHGADVNKSLSAGKDKMTPLMLASSMGYLNIARVLVQSNAAVDMLDKKKRSALTHAIINGNTTVASYLLYLGADPNRADSSNNTLVHYAAAYGWYFCLRLLLKDAGADPDTPNDWQTTPVNIALLKGNMGLVEMLINHRGVDINFKSDQGLTLPSILCRSRIRSGLETMLEALVKNFKADPTIADVNGFNALHHLAANNIKLKDHGVYWANPEVDQNCMAITVKMAEILIGAGCDPTLRTNDGRTAIMLAIEQVNVDLVTYLVEHGGTVSSEKNKDEKTVLHLMAEQCCTADLTSMLQVLVKAKPMTVPVLVPKENGKMKLDEPVEQTKEPEAMEVDKDTNTTKTASDADGPKPVEANNINGTDEEMKEGKKEKPDDKADTSVMENNVNNKEEEPKEPKTDKSKPSEKEGGTRPVLQTQLSQMSQLETLQKMSADRDFLGFTPLLRACQVYSKFQPQNPKVDKAQYALDFIKALMELTGSDVNATVGPKNMPDEPELHYAPEGMCSTVHLMISPLCETYNPEKTGAGLKMILKYKPDVNQKNQQGKTPLILAVESSKESVLKALLEAGANANIGMTIGTAQVSPLIMAADRASFGIMKMLVDYKADVQFSHSENLRTPAHIMAMNRVKEDETIAMLQTLLVAGANINTVDKEGNTPLHLAVISNRGHSDTSTSMEEFLLNRGANIFAKNKELLMPLHVALDKSGILMRGESLAKHSSSRVDPIELCSLLTSFMRDQHVDEPSVQGFTPLLYAASSGATICCMHLLQRSANLEAKEYRGNTPLNLAIHNGHDSCAIMLMQRKASLSHPIVITLTKKIKDKVESEDDKKPKRPVMMWQPRKQWESAQLKEIPGQTMTLFEGAVKNDLSGVAHMLLDAQGMPMEAVEAALNLSKFNLALRLLRRIPDVNRLHVKNKEGQNLFHVLASKSNRNSPDLQVKVAGALLEKRLSLSEKDNKGMTPLMYAALKHQSVALAKFLIQNDLQFNPKVRDGMNRDVMSAFMWDYDWVSDKFKLDDLREWLELLTGTGQISFDTLYDHPLPDPLLLGAKIDVPQPNYFETHGTDRTTPLIFAIRNYDFGLAKYMLQKGASPNFADSRGMTPMMHAVQMNDSKMVKLLLNYTYDPDTDSTTPVKGAIKPQLSKEQSREVFNICFDAAKEKNPDDLLDEEVNPSEDDAVSLSKHTEENEDSVDLNEDDDDEEELPIEDAELSDKEDDDEEQEDSDADTDIVEDEDVAATAVVTLNPDLDAPAGATKLALSRHVSTLMTEREFNSLEKTSSVDLSVMDKNGWTAAHHAVCSVEHATFDNAEIVYLLAKAGAPLEAKNHAGETVMDLARKTDAPLIVKVLNKLLALEPYNKPTQAYDSKPSPFAVKDHLENKVKREYLADAEKMLDKLDAESGDEKEALAGPKPDTNCEIKNSGEVAHHPVTNIPYDVTLSKVDVSFGVWGMYNFYKLQIIRHTAKKMFILFTRWGRIGSRGQYQHTPFRTIEEAAKEFCKVYKSKTGNDWNSTAKFQNHPKKYRLMPKSDKAHKQHKVEFNLESSLSCSLPEPVLDLVTEISNVSMFLASMTKVGLRDEFMPFGRINRKALLEARRMLTELSELIDKATKMRNNYTNDMQEEYQSICEELSQLTNEYYHILPLHGFEYDTIRPISDKKMLREHTKVLGELMDVQVANTILLGAKYKKPEVHPMDYVYSSLGCSVQPLPENHPDAQFILTNIHASVPSAKINRMFKVSREGECERLAALNLPNQKLLWHGTSMANIISILSRGLLVTPPEVPWTGHLFGEGIYFADTFMKSAGYCHNHSPKSNVKVMLLCQVALGNSKVDVKHGDEDHLDDDINSLKILGKNAPNTDFDARLPFGASLSLGQVQDMVYHPPARIHHNEYIVHSADQAALRYLVLYHG